MLGLIFHRKGRKDQDQPLVKDTDNTFNFKPDRPQLVAHWIKDDQNQLTCEWVYD